MQVRATLRVLRLPTVLHQSNRSLLISTSSACHARTYASQPSKPPRPSPTTPSARTRKPPAPHAFPAASVGARQTSPGTSIPKDQTWKPQDSIKFGESAAATAPGAGHQIHGNFSAARKSAVTPIDGSRTAEQPVGETESPIESTAAAQQPVVQQTGADAPAPHGVRGQAQDKQAAAENTPPPPDSRAEPDSGKQPQNPLPDLRFGIPSTIDFELGQKRATASGSSTQQGQGENFDITSAPPDTQERRDGEERGYDQSVYETSFDRRRARFANYTYLSILVGSVAACLYLSRPFGDQEEVPSGLSAEDAVGWAPGKLYSRVGARLGSQLGYYTEPTFPKLLPDVPESQRAPLTLVLSLEDLMIHSTWDRKHGYRTAKRPGIDYFIRYLSQYYELVLFTSVPIAMADPVMKKLDPYHFIMWQLGREATKYEGGEYVKDLAYLNRPLSKTIIVDTLAPHVKNQPENAIIIPKWNGDPKDPHVKDLVALIPFLEYVATMGIEDVRPVLKSFEGQSIPEEFARREAEARRKFNAELEQERKRRPAFSVASLAGRLGIKGSAAGAGGMILSDGQSVAEGLAQGKMLSDQFREQGQRQYEYLEKQIRENGAQWLKEEEEEQKKLMEAHMRDMKKSAFSWFGSQGGDK